jgi:hypothetical protein
LYSKKPDVATKAFREIGKKAAVSDAAKTRDATLKKTARLRGLRLAHEAVERAAQPAKSKKQTRGKRKLPPFEREG